VLRAQWRLPWGYLVQEEFMTAWPNTLDVWLTFSLALA
jgi:hypothetical protein